MKRTDEVNEGKATTPLAHIDAPVDASDADATTAAAPPSRPRVSPWKAGAVAVVLVALTPLFVAFGVLGKLLTAPASTLSRTGIALLVLLAGTVLVEVYLVEVRHSDSFVVEFASADDTDRMRHALESERNFLQMLALLGFVLTALVVGQWRFHALVIASIDAPLTLDTGARLLVDTIAPLFFVALLWDSVYALQHWQFVTGLTLVSFAAVFVLTPLVVAVSHAKCWVPARYKDLERIERRILRANVSVPFTMAKIAGLGTVHVPFCGAASASSTSPPKTLVLVHGYAAGNGLWACNLEHLAKTFDVYAIEWIGTGRSDRPDFVSYEQEAADAIFVNAIEEWRKEIGLKSFHLCGHSMGALFASSYAVRFPSRVQHLVLVSPAGVGKLPPLRPQVLGIRLFRFLWSLRLTPMSVARYAGPFGPALLRAFVKLRVSLMPPTSVIKRGLIPLETAADYWYHNWALKRSGEIAMHTHLHPGVFARKPICEMLTPATIQVPITFMYGGGPDWMDSKHGEELAATFDGHQRVDVLHVPLAGHQVFMDNVEAFNEMLVAALVR